MTRLKQAWLALCGKLEPEVRYERIPVFGDAILASVFRATRHDGLGGRRHRFFQTCEQAHADMPGCEVVRMEAIKADGRYFSGSYGLSEINIQPKPKVAKGSKRAS